MGKIKQAMQEAIDKAADRIHEEHPEWDEEDVYKKAEESVRAATVDDDDFPF